MNKSLITAVLFVLTTSTYAAFQQNISICLSVDENKPKAIFVGGFVSSDWLDKGTSTFLRSGKQCIEHTYGFGPKNITLEIKAYRNSVEITEDTSCPYMHQGPLNIFKFEKYRATYKKEHWDFHFTQIDLGNHSYKFIMSCNWSYD